jgi:hypothetical protein
MVDRQEFASRIAEAAAMLDYAEESFKKLATLIEASLALADKPEIGRSMARIAQEMAEGLADTFGTSKSEYNAECRRVSGEMNLN